MLAGRPHEAAGNGSPRWMAAGPRKRVHRTRPTGRLARRPHFRPGSVASAWPAYTARDRAIMATAIVAGLALVASLFAGPLAGPLVVAAAGSISASMLLLRVQMRSQRTRRPGGHLPPQRGVGSGSNAAHRAISAASAERFPHAGKQRRRSEADATRRHFLRPQLSG
jgi:hypothetical protein